MTTTILPTRNEAWGFHGTIRHHAEPGQAWHLAFTAIAAASGASPEGIRDFLDSRHGRHFADDVSSGLTAGQSPENVIAAAVDRWMGWQFGRKLSRETGIPAGLPYLTGFITHFEIMAEPETQH